MATLTVLSRGAAPRRCHLRIDFRGPRIELTSAYVGPAGAGKRTSLQRLPEVVDGSWEPTTWRGLPAVLAHLPRLGPTSWSFDWTLVTLDLPQETERLRAGLQSAERGEAGDLLGLVFVADSAPGRQAANMAAWEALAAAHLERGLPLVGWGGEFHGERPLVFQWNKQDLPDAVGRDVLQRALDPGRVDRSATATTGAGLERVLEALRSEIVRFLDPPKHLDRDGYTRRDLERLSDAELAALEAEPGHRLRSEGLRGLIADVRRRRGP
ncbi:MAG: hypothetical protein AB7N76_12415 [Planctomycetota bacterium]